MKSHIRIIANGAAKGMAPHENQEAFTQLVKNELPDATVEFTARGANVTELAQHALDDGATTIVAAGGDGTVNALASAVVGTNAVLGVLPMGTLNHFAADIGIPASTQEALRVLSAGSVEAVDVGTVNDRIFLNNSGLGLYPDMVHRRIQRQEKGAGKWLAGLVEGLNALQRYRLLGIRVVVNGEAFVRRTPAVFIGNNEYCSQILTLPTRSRLDGGVLSLYIPHATGRLTLAWFAIRMLLFRTYPDDGFDVSLTDAVTIESKRHLLIISLDGEVTHMPPPLNYRIRQRALNVIVPAAT